MINENMRQKLQKLFTMAERGEGNEAEVAMKKLRQFMQEYGITQSDIELFFYNTKIEKRKKRLVSLLHELCSSFCGVLSFIGYMRYTFAGDELGVNVAQELFIYLQNEVIRKTSEKVISGRKAKNDYRLGIILGISERMKECGGWRDMQEKRKIIKEKYFKAIAKAASRPLYVDMDFIEMGKEKAQEINLSRQAGYNGVSGFLTGGKV